MIAVAGAANVNFVERAVTAVVVVLAVGYVASNTEIDGFHSFTSVTLFCVGRAKLYAAIDKTVG